MARENVGEIVCICGTEQPLRRDKNGYLYIACAGCGILQFKGMSGQALLMERGKLYGGEGAPAKREEKKTPAAAPAAALPAKRRGPQPPAEKAAAPAPSPTPKEEQPATNGGWLDDL